jgi:septal ring factor EnvC (AmiA/AmiB activator)
MLRPFQHSALLAFGLIVCGTLFAQAEIDEQALRSTKKYQASIGDIGEKIKNISRNLNANKELVASERDALLDAERKIVTLRETLQKIDYELAKSKHELDALRRQMSKTQRSQAEHREALKGLLKSRYYNGKPDLLKKILNQENPYAVGRLANYNNYFSSALKARFELLREKTRRLAKLNQDLGISIDALKKERAQKKRAEENFNKSKQSRAKTIAKLDKKIATNTELLEKLKADRERLKLLLKQLKIQSAEMKRLDELKAKEDAKLRQRKSRGSQKNNSRREPIKGGFLKQKGRLSYPVDGKLLRSFGSRLPESGMRSEGSFFSTEGSVSVKSIFRGRVLFADFLKGYGLLIIVDHGDNHISLYGHNDRLFKKVGDKIDSGEVIAKSGVTGGLKSHGLYFEIRDNATPIDVSKWCR